MITRAALLLLAACAFTPPTIRAEPDQDWETRAAAVSDGELRLLAHAPSDPAHRHANHIEISAASLEDGWVALSQCHEDLDPVPALQITYHPERISDLRIISRRNIGKAWVEANSVQLTDVGKRARVCIGARSRALHRLPDGGYELRTGPYMRRFLDGYYPMRLDLEVLYPSRLLHFVEQTPLPRVRLAERDGMQTLSTGAWFEGRLHSVVRFCASRQKACGPGLE